MTTEVTEILDLNNLDSKISNALDNNYLNLGLGLFLILYAAIIAPKLSSKQRIVKWVNHWLIKLLLFFIIIYVSSKNVTLSIVILIAVISTLLVSEKATLVYVDQYGFNKLPKDQQFIETKDTSDVVDNYSELEIKEIDYPDDNEVGDDVINGIADESLENSTLFYGQNVSQEQGSDIENNLHPMDQGAMTSLGRSIKMLLSPSDNTLKNSDGDDSESFTESENIQLHNSVKQVTAEIEQEQGSKVPENTKRVVLGQLKQKFNNMSLRNNNIPSENEVLQVCRDMYRSLLL